MPSDKRTRSIKELLRNTVKRTGGYATGTAKLFLASGKDMFTSEMPTITGMFDVNKELLQDAVRFLRNPTDVINTQIDRAVGSESYQELKRFVQYAVDDLKTGKLYDANRDRTELGIQMDEMMSSFGGFDMSGFDENGDWSESDSSTEEFDSQMKIAEVQEENAGKRTEATINAIGTATEAIINTQNANSQQALRMNMKQHQQMMSSLQNTLAAQASTFELISKSVSAQLDLTKEIHTQMMTQLTDMKNLLTEIRDNTAPREPSKQEAKQQADIFGFNGELNIKSYLKSVTSQINDYFGIGNAVSMATGGMSPKQLIETVISNPWQLVSDQILRMIVPKSTINKMQTTNRNLGSFAPALLQKFGERRKKYESGEGGIVDLLLSFLGPKTTSNSSINTEYENPIGKATITNKTTRAIEEVIPMWLSKIYSAVSGAPLQIYNYSTGKLELARNVVSSNVRNSKDLTGRMGEGAYEITERAGAYNFKNRDEEEKFQNFIYQYLQKQAEDNAFINPFVTKEEFMKTMPSEFQSGKYGEQYYALLAAILRSMPRDKLASLSKEIYNARISRNNDNATINNNLKNSGLIAAFSGFLSDDIVSQVSSKSMDSSRGLTEDALSKIETEYQNRLIKNGTGTAATNKILNDILGTLKRGIITYTYNIGTRETGSDVSDIFKSVLDDANKQNDIENRLRQMIIDDDRRTMERRQREEEDARNRQKDNIAPSLKDIVSDNFETLDSAEDFQRRVAINMSTPGQSNNPDVERQRKQQEEHRKEMQRLYSSTLTGNIDNVLQKTGAKGILDKAKEYMDTPFKLFEDALSVTDAFLYKMLFGEDSLSQLDLNGEPFLLQTLTNSLKKHFLDAKDWFGENIGSPLKKYLFDKDEGLIPRIGHSLSELLGLDNLKDKAKNKTSELKDKLLKSTLGTKNEDGTYSGGRFSTTINKVHNTGDTIDKTISNAVGRLLYGDYASEKGVHVTEWESTYNGDIQTTKSYGGVIGSLRKGFDKTREYLFGPEDEETDSRKKWNMMKGELNKAFPDMIIGGGAGLLGSLFLPGGPVLGMVLGSTAGLIKGSDNLKSYLFGEFSDEDEEYDQVYYNQKTGKLETRKKTRKKQTKKGLFNREITDGLQKYLPGIGKGALAGALAGGLGLLPFGLGSTAGMVIGSIGGMLASSDQVRELIFGDGVDPDSGLLSENFKKKVTEKFKKYAPAGVGGAAIGAMLGEGLGLLPGMSLLPGGPIFGLLGAMTGIANADKINEFFFGKDAQVTKNIKQEDGTTKTVTVTEKQGGIFNRVVGYTEDHLLKPFADKINIAGGKISNWFHESIIQPLGNSIAPLRDQMSKAGKSILDSFANIGNHITESLGRVFNISINGDDGKGGLKAFFHDKVLKRLEGMANKMFDTIGKVLGSIISAPFKALEYIVTGTVSGSKDDIDKEDKSGGIFNSIQNRLQDSRRRTAERRSQRAFNRASQNGSSLQDRLKSIFTSARDTVTDKVNGVLGNNTQANSISNEQRKRNDTLKQKLLDKRNGIIDASYTQDFDISKMNDSQVESYLRWRNATGGKGDRSDYRNWLKIEKRKGTNNQTTTTSNNQNRSIDRTDAAINEKQTTRKIGKKTNNEYLDEIAKYTKKIFNEIKGQVNGVGWNTAYIKTILEKQYGPLGSDELPEEMEGSTKRIRKRRGIVGKAMDFLGDKFGGIKDRAMGAIDKAKGVLGVIFHPFQLIAEGAKFAFNALTGFGKGLLEVAKTAGSMLKEILVGAAKGLGGILAGAGKFIAASAKGVGEALGNALGTLTGVIHDTVLGISSIATGLIQTAAEIFPDVVKGLWKGAKALGKGAVKVAGAGVRAAAGGAGWLMNKITGKDKDGNATKIKKKFLGNVNIIGGKLDKIDSEVPISIGDSISRIPFPYVNLIRGRARRRTTEAIPVYVAGFDKYAKIPRSGDPDNGPRKTDDFKKAYDDVDRKAEKSKDPGEVYDRAVKDAKTQEEVQAVLASQQMNATNNALVPYTGNGSQEKESSGFLSTLFDLLTGGKLSAIAKSAGSLLLGSLPILGSIGTIAYGASNGQSNVTGRGTETLMQTVLRKFGINNIKASEVKNMVDNPILATMASDTAKRSGEKGAAQTAKGLARFANLSEFMSMIADPKNADAAIELGKESGSKSLRASGYAAKAIGGVSRLGSNIGSKIANSTVGTVAKNAASTLKSKAKTLLQTALDKFFKNGTVQKMMGSAFAKKIGQVKTTIIAKLTGEAFDKAATMTGKETLEGILRTVGGVSTAGIVTAAFAVADFISGWNSAYKTFGVYSSQVTTSMKFTSAVVRALTGIISIIPGVGTVLSIALSIAESGIVDAVWRLFADEDAESELAEMQTQTAQAANEVGMSVDDYVKNYNEDGSQKLSSKIWNGIKSVGSTIWGGIKSAASGIKNFFTGGSGKGPMKHFSQSDNRWNKNDPTMKNVGCGPTAAAMVASAYGKGGKANPSEANMMSKALGMRASDGGTDPRFFKQYAAGKGFGMEQGPATSGMLSANLSKGRPAVLMGKGGPFGDNVHYLVADKLTGKGKANVVDPITGGSKSVTMDSLLRNTSNAIYSYGKGPSDTNTDDSVDTENGKVSVGDAQQALVNKMKSIYGKIKYSQSNPQDPDKGQASCASTVAWAYQKVLGYRPGGSSYASSSGQSKDANFVTIYQNNGKPIDPSILQPGDIMYINHDRTTYDPSLAYPMQHTEMYAGNMQDLSHGGPGNGPTYKSLNDYRIKHLMMVRRYKPFTNGQDIQIYDNGGSSSVASGMNIGDYSNEPAGIAALNTISDIFSSVGTKYDNILNVLLNKNTDENEDTSGDTSVDGASTKNIPVTQIRGNTTAQKIVNFLRDHKFNDYGIAGIMGNMYKESGLISNNLQNTYNSKFGMSDSEYTTKTDNGTYKNFTSDNGGYGLIQWTPKSRKTRLYNLAKERGTSVSDVGTQLDLMLQELTEYGLLGGLQYAKSVKDASDNFLYNFEKPANADKQSSIRAEAAQSFYDQLQNNETSETSTGKGPKWGTGPSVNLNTLNKKVQNINTDFQKAKTEAAEGTTVTQLTNKINEIVTNTKDSGNKDNDTLLAISKTLATMVELLAAIKDNTAQTKQTKAISSTSSGKTPTANADSFSSNPYVYGEYEDVGSRIIDALTTK